MNKLIKQFVLLMLSLLVLITCSGCGVAVQKSKLYKEDFEINTFTDATVTENDNFRLDWDNENKRIILVDKFNGVSWSTTPEQALNPGLDEFGYPKTVHPQVTSPIVIEYIDSETQEISMLTASVASIMNDCVSVERIKGGIKATYYFPDVEIAVPVEYTILNNGVNIAIDSAGIQEKSYMLWRIKVAPFMCSFANNSDNSYLFVPSGSGALIYKKQEGDVPVTYSQEVYGTDSGRYLEYEEDSATENEIRLPVYGAKMGNKALCAIIDDGAESASIEVSAGAANIGSSAVNASFEVRGYQWVKVKKGYQKLFSESISNNKYSVSFYPLYGNAADYVGMADVYREYLKQKYNLESVSEENNLALKIIGGSSVKNSFLGIPYNDFYATTTVNEATEIVTELFESTKEKMSVNLVGFGQGGINVGKIAGGFKLDSNLGNRSDLEKFIEYCEKNGIRSFMDFDAVRFNKTAGGLSTLSDKAVTVNGQVVNCYNYNVWSRTRDFDFENYSLATRSKLFDIATRITKATSKLGITGVGLDTLSNYCYSDYSNAETFIKGSMQKDVSSILSDFKKDKIKIAVNNANDYAAANANQIYDAPLESSGHRLFDEDIPFYEIVFKGYVPMSSPSVNLVANSKETILKAIESGIGLTYTLISDYDTKLLVSSESAFYGSVYSDMKPYIEKSVLENKDYYGKINGTTIKEHIIYENGVRKTVFDNGYEVFVNYTDKIQTISDITVEPFGYKLIAGGEDT